MLRPQTAVVAAFALAAGSSCLFGGPAPVIKIGVDLPLSGVEARAALPALNGIRYYVQQHPTVGGFTIVLSESDDSTGGLPDSNRGADNVRAFLRDPLVAAMIGPFDSNVARAEIPVTNSSLLAMVSPVTSSPCLTQDVYLPAALSLSRRAVTCKDAGLPAASDLHTSGSNNYFRLAPTDQLQGPAAADHLFKTLQLVRAAVISDHEAYGQALADSFTTRYIKLGGSVVGRLDLDSSADPVAFLKRMKADGARAVYYGGVTANRGCAIRSEMLDAFGTDVTIPFLGGDGIAEDPACVRDAGANFACRRLRRHGGGLRRDRPRDHGIGRHSTAACHRPRDARGHLRSWRRHGHDPVRCQWRHDASGHHDRRIPAHRPDHAVARGRVRRLQHHAAILI